MPIKTFWVFEIFRLRPPIENFWAKLVKNFWDSFIRKALRFEKFLGLVMKIFWVGKLIFFWVLKIFGVL